MAKYGELTFGQTEALVNKIGGMEAVAKILSGNVVVKIISMLLDIIGTVAVPATTKKFVARDNFVVNTGADAKPRISYLGPSFKSWFLGKVEEARGETVLCYAKLTKSSMDGPVITELGGEGKAETSLSEVFHLMSLQPRGKEGALLNDGQANIFYIKDVSGVLRTVSVYWYGGGWYVNADKVSHPSVWNDGDQVFSRNF